MTDPTAPADAWLTADDLLKIRNLEADAQRIGRAAEAVGDYRAAVAANRELRKLVALRTRISLALEPPHA